MKMPAVIIGVVAVGLATCWATGLVEFTYLKIVPNEPLLHPKKVRSLDGTNMVLETGEIIGLWPRYSSERSGEEISLEVSNQVSRGGFEVDIERKTAGRLELFVRWRRKFRDYGPLVTIPLIRKTVGSYYRKPVAFGAYLGTNSQPDGAANRGQPVGPDTKRTSAAAGPVADLFVGLKR